MKHKKLLAFVFCLFLLFLVTSCMTVENSADEYLYNDDGVVVFFRNDSENAIKSYISKNKNDKTKTKIRNTISAESRTNYSINQQTESRLEKSFKANFSEAVSSRGFNSAYIDNARFILEGNVDVSYVRTEQGVIWMYEAFISARDKLNQPLDYNRSDLVKHENALKNTTVIDNLDRHETMSWSTHGQSGSR